MFCNKCGTQNDDGALFCQKCGNDLRSIEPPNTIITPPPIQGTASAIKNKAASKTIIVIIIAAVLLIGLSIGSVVVLTQVFSGKSDSSGLGDDEQNKSSFNVGDMFAKREEVKDMTFSYNDDFRMCCYISDSKKHNNLYGKINITMTGTYTGEIMNGKPDGKGIFTPKPIKVPIEYISFQSDDTYSASYSIYNTWGYPLEGRDSVALLCIYDGEWVNGEFTGYGHEIDYVDLNARTEGNPVPIYDIFEYDGYFENGKLNGSESKFIYGRGYADNGQLPKKYTVLCEEYLLFKDDMLNSDAANRRLNYNSFGKILEYYGGFTNGVPNSDCVGTEYDTFTGKAK